MARLFGTNGIRWVVASRGPDFAVRLGVCAGTFFGSGDMAIAMDTRTSSPMIFNAMAAGLLSRGCNALDLGVVPTPVVQYAVKRMDLMGGLMVTASHNPPEFNGLKVFSSDGTEIPRAEEERFEALFDRPMGEPVGWNGIGTCRPETHIQSNYISTVRNAVPPGANGLNVVVDCANGTAIGYTPTILENAGCLVTALNSVPDGRFPGRMPEPVRENVGELISKVSETGADLGIAHDGDADRATFVDDTGSFVTGDQSLAVFALDTLRRLGRGSVVVPINTSRMVEEIVVSNGGRIDYTAVGSPLIARRMMDTGAVLGGEGNGGVIFPEHLHCRDGMMAAARMVDVITRHGPLSELVAGLPRFFIRSEKVKINPQLKDRILKQVRRNAQGQVNEIDGIRTEIDEGWVLVRASGTEPIMRVTVETDSEESCKRILRDGVNYLKEVIEGLS